MEGKRRMSGTPTTRMLGFKSFGSAGPPGNEPAATNRDDQRVQIGLFGQHLQRQRALACGHGGIVKG